MSSIYKGWIPTASGKLSFSIIGSSKYPTPAKTANIADLDSRQIISFQKRPLIDSSFPLLKKLFVSRAFGQDGTFWFTFIAQGPNSPTNDSNEIRGKVYIYSEKKKWKELVQNIKEYQADLKNFSEETGTSLEQHFKSKRVELHRLLELNCISEIDVILKRSGVTTLEYVEATSSQSNEMRNNIDRTKALQNLVCEQSFFYLKDIIHEHQHHSQKTDTMIGLHLIKEKESEATWYSRTLKRLYKRVLEFKRCKDQNIYASTLGLLAYVESFCTIAKEELSDEEFKKIPLKNHETLKSSIKASDDQSSQKYTDRKRIVDTVRTTLFSLVGVFLSLAGFANFLNVESAATGELRTYISNMISFSESHFQWIMLLTSILIVGILIYEGLINWKKWLVFHDIVRIVQPFRKEIASMIVLSIGVVTAAIFYMIYGIIPVLLQN